MQTLRSCFRFDRVLSDADYTDYIFRDNSPNGAGRIWRVTWNHEAEYWFGVLSRPQEDEDGFDFSVEMPGGMVGSLIGLIPTHLMPYRLHS